MIYPSKRSYPVIQITRRGVSLIICILVLCLASTVFVSAQQIYILQRNIISSASNGALHGNGYNMVSLVGQPVVGSSKGTGFQVAGGIPLVTPNPPPQTIYLPVIKK
jgi:hypothetical protein